MAFILLVMVGLENGGVEQEFTFSNLQLALKGLLNCLITFLFINGFERMRAFWKSEIMYDNQMTLDFQFKFSKTKWQTIKINKLKPPRHLDLGKAISFPEYYHFG